MKLEETLDEESLKKFVAERITDIVEAQKKAKSKLKKRKRKPLSEDQDDSDTVNEASIWSEAVKFLKGNSADLLMPMVLFDKKVLSDAYKAPEATAKQRALFQFAAEENISTAIQTFREKYPNWKKAKKQLMPKKEEQNTSLEINPDQSGVVENEEITQIPPKKLKKKAKAAFDSESSTMPEERKLDTTNDIDENGKLPKKKKKKKKSKLVENTPGEETEKENSPSSDTLAKPGTKKLNAIEKVIADGAEALKKLNAIKKVVANGAEALNAATPGKDGSPNKANNLPVKRKGPSHPPPVGKKPKFKKLEQDNVNGVQNNGFANGENAEGEGEGDGNGHPRQSDGFQSRNHGRGGNASYNNRRSGENGNGSGSLPSWKIRRFVDRNSPNSIQVSPDWQKKVVEAKGDDEPKPSLLRPAWLTNPEDYKSIFEESIIFRKNEWEPASANEIPVPSDWKNKALKQEDGEGTPSTGTSLLRPSWLINPEEHKSTPTHETFGGNFQGKKTF